MSTPLVHIQSFGYGHMPPDFGLDMTFDLRDWFRDPHVSPQLRNLNGGDQLVIDAVLNTDGVHNFLEALVTLALGQALLGVREVRVGIGCVGGRHRSVVIAEQLGARLAKLGLDVEVSHRDVNKPVLTGTRVTK